MQQGAKCCNWKEILVVHKKQKKEEDRKRAPALSRNADFGWWIQKECLQLCRKRGKWRSYCSERKISSDELFVTCLNDNSENKIKPIKNNLVLFLDTSLNHMSIRSCLVSQSKNELISNSEQLFNTTDLSPINFGVILPPNLWNKNSTNSQNNPGTLNENKNSIVRTIKILLDSGASASIVCKDVLSENNRIITKRINGQLWQGPLILIL